MQEKPKISIILPCYNGASMLGRAIESVQQQTYQDWELVIVNDCSTDNTLEVAQSYAEKDERIRVFSNAVNSKLPATLNHGFRAARGEYWTWTSDDNLLHSNMFAEMATYLDEHPEVGFVTGDQNIIDPNDAIIGEVIVPDDIQQKILLNDYIEACFMYRSSVAKQVGEYREDLFLVEDYEYWIRMSFVTKFATIHKKLYSYRVHPNSLSSTRQKDIANRLVRMRLMHLDEVEKSLSDKKGLLALFYYRIVDNLQGKEKWHYLWRFMKNNACHFGVKYIFIHVPHRIMQSITRSCKK